MTLRTSTYQSSSPDNAFPPGFLEQDPYLQLKKQTSASVSVHTLLGSTTSTGSQRGLLSKTGILLSTCKLSPPTVPNPALEHLGYADELTRDHDALSLLGVCVANIGFLQGTLFGVIAAVSAGGSSMLTIGWPITSLFMLALSAAMAEFGSAYPVSGAMFTWTWKLARGSAAFKPYSRFFSWVVGSFLLCGHVLSQILLSYQFATALQGTIIIFHPNFNLTKWTTAGFAWAEILLLAIVVSFPISRSPYFWKAVLLEIFIAFLLLIVFLAESPTPFRPASAVFLTYTNTTGFNSKCYVYLLGWASTCLATGQDVACHLSEETKSPEKAVPLACFWSVFISYVLGWVSICVLCASIPTELVLRLSERYFPPAEILAANMDNNRAGVVLGLILVAMFVQGIAQMLAASRYAYALARDKALPFSRYISYVAEAQRIPYFAVWAEATFTCLGLLLITVSNELVMTLFLAGCGVSILFSYGAPCFLYLFVRDKAFLDNTGWRWTLRRASKPASVVAVALASFAIVILSFPTQRPIKPENVGWAPVVLCCVLVLSCFSWILYGNGHYAGPIKILLGPSVELPSHSITKSKNTGLTSTDIHGNTARVLYTSGDASSIDQDYLTTDYPETPDYESQGTPTLPSLHDAQ